VAPPCSDYGAIAAMRKLLKLLLKGLESEDEILVLWKAAEELCGPGRVAEAHLWPVGQRDPNALFTQWKTETDKSMSSISDTLENADAEWFRDLFIGTWAKFQDHRDRDGAELTEKLLKEMNDYYEAGKNALVNLSRKLGSRNSFPTFSRLVKTFALDILNK